MKKIFSSRFIKCIALILCVAAMTLFLQNCLFVHHDHNTRRIRQFYEEENNSLDVVIIGASEVFTGYSPGYAYDKYGFTSYMYAMDSNKGALYKSQLKEVLAHQTPQVIYVEAYGFLHSSEDLVYGEPRFRMYIENIPMSLNKLETIMEYPYEDKLSCLFPLMKYHGDLGVAKAQLSFMKKQLFAPDIPTSLKGLTTYADVYDGPGDAGSKDSSAYSICDSSKEILVDFLTYCKQEGLDNIVFVNFPRYLEDLDNNSLVSRVRIAREIIEEHGFQFLDLQEHSAEIGIDEKQDYYNMHHLNIYGQQKVTEYLGAYSMETLGVIPMQQSDKNKQQWEEAASCTEEFYNIVEQEIKNENAIWLNEFSDEWVFRPTQK